MPSHDVAAVYQYCSLTGSVGVEFVVVSSFVDAVPFRQFGHDLWLVPCRNTLMAAVPEQVPSTPGNYLYDGWLPLSDKSDDTIVAGLRRIDELVASLAHVHACPCRWVVKYVEYRNQRRNDVRHLTEADNTQVSSHLSRLASLPDRVRAAAVRCMTWLENSRQQTRQSDRFLSLWLALESLVLTLFDEAAALQLPVHDDYSGVTRTERDAQRRDAIRNVLASVDDPLQAVTTAYFHCVVSVRKRTELTLAAVFGADHRFAKWPYSLDPRYGKPSDIRADLVHRGVSGVDAATTTNFDALSEDLETLIESALNRVLERKWGGSEPNSRSRTFVAIMNFDDMPLYLQGPARVVTRPTEITPELLAAKGLL
jgi:hypothetical protein